MVIGSVFVLTLCEQVVLSITDTRAQKTFTVDIRLLFSILSLDVSLVVKVVVKVIYCEGEVYGKYVQQASAFLECFAIGPFLLMRTMRR